MTAANDPIAASKDAQLMKQIQSDSTDAFEQLYDRYSARAWRVARSVCHNEGRAEDAVQEAFMSIWRSRSTYRPGGGTVAAWLMCVVHHRAIDISRNHSKHASRRADEQIIQLRPAPGDLADQVLRRDGAGNLRKRLTGLPDAQREVIVLAFYGQLTHTEIATQLELPSGTVKGRMRLGLRKLRAEIEQAA